MSRIDELEARIARLEELLLRRRGARTAGKCTSKFDTPVAKILGQAGRPMKTTAILRALEASGVVVSGKDRGNNLAAHLSHSDLFASSGDGWRLAETVLST